MKKYERVFDILTIVGLAVFLGGLLTILGFAAFVKFAAEGAFGNVLTIAPSTFRTVFYVLTGISGVGCLVYGVSFAINA